MTKEQSYTRFWEGSKRMGITFGVCPDNSYCKCAGRHFK